jgi:hypothetical protein
MLSLVEAWPFNSQNFLELDVRHVMVEGGDLKDDPVGIVALANRIESAGSQDTVQGQEAIVEQDAANTYDVVHVGAVAYIAQQPQVHLSMCQYQTQSFALDPLPVVRGIMKSTRLAIVPD